MSKVLENRVAPIVAQGQIELELHTKSALRLWFGRAKTKEKHGIMGLPGFSAKMRILENNIRKDDPYAYYHFDMMSKEILSLSKDYDDMDNDIEAILATIPRALKVPSVASNNPTNFDINFASRLGFRTMYQLIKADNIAMKIIKAAHIDLLSVSERIKMLNLIETRMRALFNTSYQYVNCDVTRDDMAANNQRARNAIAKMGELPEGYLTGEIVIENAPRLPDRLVKSQLDADLSEDDIEKLLEEMSDVDIASNDQAKTGTDN